MAGTPLPFAVTARPGQRPGEFKGDLINAYARKNGDEIEWKRVPGLDRFTPALAEASRRIPRGQLDLDTYLLTAWEDRLDFVDALGGVETATGEIMEGDEPVTMAQNQRNVPQIVIVTDTGVYITDSATKVLRNYPDAEVLADFPDSAANLGNVNSVCIYAGYFIFTRPDGTIVASDLQNAGIPDSSDDEARQASDGALRSFNNGDTVLIMGTKTVEVWIDAAKSPFPLAFAASLDVGLLGRWAVAGGPMQWERSVLWVGTDYTVRQLDGYTPTIVSDTDVQRDIFEARFDPEGFRAQVYTVDGQAVWCLSHHNWCWCYNLDTKTWHRRKSYNTTGWWRGQFCTRFNNAWYVQDLKKDGLLEITSEVQMEDDERLIATIVSAPLKDFPLSVRVPVVHFNFTVGLGRLGRPYAEEDPAVQISWSHNGAATFGNPVVRSLGKQGQYNTLVKVHSMGRTTHQGMIIKLVISDPVDFTFTGAFAPTLAPSKPRQVAR